ncbi:MAG: bifunctional oligoribonuclease/PAP phosphatase NrnA [Patescibacteria group bacterium]|nr:bifunctional oligoribonuclease/PAP phosphatase NrnA [Patescibacteria group bacterium]
MKKQKFRLAGQKIKSAKKILLITHDRPDGDAVSSTCALIEYIDSLHKNFDTYCFNQPPQQFNFLPRVNKINSNKNRLTFSQYDLIIVSDCGGLNRTKLSAEILGRKPEQYIIEFDHHPKIDNYADLEIKNCKISSTCEILYNFFKINNIFINKNIANCLLTGILTDTANFLFPITTDTTIKIASELLLLGAKFPLILNNTWRNKSFAVMKIWGEALNNLQINPKHNLAYSVLKHESAHENKIIDEALEGLPEFLSNLYGVNGLLLLREIETGRIKGGLRSARPKMDVSLLAQIAGGGGHSKASGFVLEGKIIQTKNGWQIQ